MISSTPISALALELSLVEGKKAKQICEWKWEVKAIDADSSGSKKIYMGKKRKCEFAAVLLMELWQSDINPREASNLRNNRDLFDDGSKGPSW